MGNLAKTILDVMKIVIGRPADLKKFFNPTAARGRTVWPKSPADMLRYGVRWDYDGIVQQNDKEYHRFQLQPNAGKIPSTIKAWRDKNGGTHAVMATLFIEKGVDPSDEAFEESVRKSLDDL